MHGWKNPNDLFKNFEAVARAFIARVRHEALIKAKACWQAPIGTSRHPCRYAQNREMRCARPRRDRAARNARRRIIDVQLLRHAPKHSESVESRPLIVVKCSVQPRGNARDKRES